MAIGESKKRSIVKMLTYRAILTALLAIISWIFTGNLGQTTVITIVFSVSATVIYTIYMKEFGMHQMGKTIGSIVSLVAALVIFYSLRSSLFQIVILQVWK
jgi:hypothetical protein